MEMFLGKHKWKYEQLKNKEKSRRRREYVLFVTKKLFFT